MKNCTEIFIYDTLYKTLISEKPLRIRFDKIDGFMRVYDGARYLELFGLEKYNVIYNIGLDILQE